MILNAKFYLNIFLCNNQIASFLAMTCCRHENPKYKGVTQPYSIEILKLVNK